MQSQKQWELENGTVMFIKDMTMSHIKASMRKIKRDHWREEWYPTLKAEYNKRKEEVPWHL